MEWKDETTGDVCALVETPIPIESSINLVRNSSAGAISTFLGTTRDVFEGKRVTSLTYESYVEMAIESLKELCMKIRQQWSVTKIALIHKLGDCPIGEISVLIAISSEHRKESLEAVHFAIDELKKTENYETGEATWKANADINPYMQSAETVLSFANTKT